MPRRQRHRVTRRRVSASLGSEGRQRESARVTCFISGLFGTVLAQGSSPPARKAAAEGNPALSQPPPLAALSRARRGPAGNCKYPPGSGRPRPTSQAPIPQGWLSGAAGRFAPRALPGAAASLGFTPRILSARPSAARPPLLETKLDTNFNQ